jgi:phospholipase C
MASARPASVSLPAPSVSGIDHVVVLMMENRSFEPLPGGLPGSEGRQAGLQYPDPAGQLHATYHLATYQGCGSNDPDHSYQGGRDSLAAAGVSHAYYFSDVPFTALWGARYAPI